MVGNNGEIDVHMPLVQCVLVFGDHVVSLRTRGRGRTDTDGV